MGFRALCGGSRAERLSAGGSWQRPPEPSPRTRISRRASPTCQSAFTPAFWPPSMTTEESVLTQEPRPTSGLGPSPRLLSLPGAPHPHCRPGRLRPLPAPAPAGSPSPTESRPGGTTGSGPAENYFFPQTMTWDLSLEAHPLGPLSPSMQSWHQPLPRGPVAATGAKLLDPQSSGVDRREPQATPVSSRASGFPTLGLEDRILPR